MQDERSAPKRIRVTGLQEAQLPALVALEHACAAMSREGGAGAEEVEARTLADFAALTRRHDVRVAEVDGEVAGYLAWRDEAPGVAVIEELSVHPDHQRCGIGARLLAELQERARELGMEQIVVRAGERASWAHAFYKKKGGFAPLGDDAPARVRAWRSEREAAGTPLTRSGEVVLWAAIPPQPAEALDEDEGDENSDG